MAHHTFNADLELLENYVFKIDFGDEGYILTDEPEPLGTGEGPNPARLVAAAVGNCLSASLLFALRKKKQNPQNIKAHAEGTMKKIDGFWRIEKIDISLSLDTGEIDPEILKDVLKIFESYCIVTESIRAGIPVSLTLSDMDKNELLKSH